MITLKLNIYRDQEVTTLHSLLCTANNTIFKECMDKHRQCDDCPLSHLCYDLISTAHYCEKVEKERGL